MTHYLNVHLSAPLSSSLRSRTKSRCCYSQNMLPGVSNNVLWWFIGVIVAGHLFAFIAYLYYLLTEPSTFDDGSRTPKKSKPDKQA